MKKYILDKSYAKRSRWSTTPHSMTWDYSLWSDSDGSSGSGNRAAASLLQYQVGVCPVNFRNTLQK